MKYCTATTDTLNRNLVNGSCSCGKCVLLQWLYSLSLKFSNLVLIFYWESSNLLIFPDSMVHLCENKSEIFFLIFVFLFLLINIVSKLFLLCSFLWCFCKNVLSFALINRHNNAFWHILILEKRKAYEHLYY